MKTLYNYIFGAAFVAVGAGLTTSCIEETFPESDTATADQVSDAGGNALMGTVNGISSQMVQGYLVYGEQEHETDMAYPQFMIAQTEMLGDMYPGGSNSGYDWYRTYNTMSANCGDRSYFAYLPWFTLYKFVKTANSIIAVANEDNAETKAYAGIARACRAFDYYMLMVLFEPAENKYTDVSAVKGLTVPIIDENTTEDKAKNNPRVSHEEMMKFILADLEKAEELLKDHAADKAREENRMVPDLSVVYGIRAKVHLWDGDYANAAKYADLAITTAQQIAKLHGRTAVPMTAEQMEDPNSGFTTATGGWMWYLHYSAESMGNLCNFIGWMSGEADWGYSSLTCPMIDKSLYDHMSMTDVRRHLFVDPKRGDFYDYKTSRTVDWLASKPDYLALKFRCLNGDYKTYSVGGAVDVPIMRIEEMYLILAEAKGMSEGLTAGLTELNNFMKKYRDENYNFSTTDTREFQLEVLTQMRLEFWGEGNAFPSAKRLKPGVIQNYENTNAPADIFKINCEGIKPIWNLVIPTTETDANVALQGKNNPDPTQSVVGPSPVGKYADKK